MTKKQWLDFKQIKHEVGMEALLRHYGLWEKMRGKGDQVSGFCPPALPYRQPQELSLFFREYR